MRLDLRTKLFDLCVMHREYLWDRRERATGFDVRVGRRGGRQLRACRWHRVTDEDRARGRVLDLPLIGALDLRGPYGREVAAYDTRARASMAETRRSAIEVLADRGVHLRVDEQCPPGVVRFVDDDEREIGRLVPVPPTVCCDVPDHLCAGDECDPECCGRHV